MFEFAPGSTSKTIYFFLRDSTTAQPKTGITASSPGVKAAYTRQKGSAVSVTLVALSLPTSAWSSGGFIEVSSTNAPGLYRFDVPDAALVAGVDYSMCTCSFTNVLGESALIMLKNITSNVGAGSIAWTITVNDSITTLPLSGASVWITTDLAGTNTVAGALATDAFGIATFLLDAGPYYVWVQHENYTGTNPTAITVA